jgi:hypothetical protein
MAAGALMFVDGTALAASLLSHSDSDSSLLFILAPLAIGAGLMLAAYRAFRYGEQVEHRARSTPGMARRAASVTDVLDQLGVRFEL